MAPSEKNGGGGRRGSRIQKGGFVQEFRLENRSYPDVYCFFIAHASDYC